ncbi:MAG: DUF6293 family protein [Candidatus Lokiarchaeota archaeon]
MFANKVHIVFNSNEEKRITEPILRHIPNKLYYFTAFIKDTGQKDENMEFFERNIKLLKEKIPSLEIIQDEIDYTNYIEIIQKISKIIKKETENGKESEIFINVSSGSKITAIASVEASKLWKCKIYYIYSTQYDPQGEGPAHKGKMIIKTPITFPTQKPDKIYIDILKLIDDMIKKRYKNKPYNKELGKFIYKKDLVENLFDNDLLTLLTKNKNDRKRQSSKYMKSRKYLEELEDILKCIRVSDERRNKKVFITETGQEVLKIFKFLF